MRIVGDRFAVQDNDDALDLATGEMVTLSLLPAGEVAEQQQWLCRCDELHRLRHPSLAVLVDYGLIGEAHRFEAWQCGGPWRGSSDAATHVARVAFGFLRAIGLTSGKAADLRTRGSSRSPVILPAAEAGYRSSEIPAPGEWTGTLPAGVLLADRPSVGTLGEMIRLAGQSRPRIAALWGPPGSGKATALLALARIARTTGLVPIDSRLIARHHAGLAGRSLFIIERAETRSKWAAWLHATLQSPRPHVCLLAGVEEVHAIDGIALERLRPEALLSAVQPAAARETALIRRAAARAQGLPGRFVRGFWPSPLVEDVSGSASRPRAAEQPAVYGEDAGSTPNGGLRVWPVPEEVTGLGRKVEAATALIDAGRHAPGFRQLRQAIGALARRGAWLDATRGSLHLASRLLARGQARNAQEGLAHAADYAARSGDAGMLLDTAILTGESWIDMLRLDEAERGLSAALASTRSAGDCERFAHAALGLARCLFWRGRHADADATLRGWPGRVEPVHEIRRLQLLAQNAVPLRDPATAMSALTEARSRATTIGDKRAVADVEHTAAFIHLMLGDLDAVDRDGAAFLAAAEASRHPARAFATRLLQAEANRRRGRPLLRAAFAALRRRAKTLAPLLKARWELFAALTSDPSDPEAVVEQLTSASGLQALSLLAGPMNTPTGDEFTKENFVDEIVAILKLCQTAGEETAVLTELCGRVRRHLDAAGVAFVAAPAKRFEVIASDGARVDSDVAQRAIEVGTTLPPHQCRGRVEGAAAVQYGGRSIGALSARWTLGSTQLHSRASAVLSLAATAAAPILSAVVAASAARERAAPSTSAELLGVTPAMSELRRAVERAASAPFGVLIEGETGAGKELVARAIHRSGPRRDRRFCTLNCAALPDDLVEAELFGHARGSFTGAVVERAGIFEEAHGGTLFLDEVGELSPRAQAKLLRVIQEGEIRRIGENLARRVDVRIVAATNRDLARDVTAGRFRLDLLYRLDVIRIGVPPLRERREDVALLVDHFWMDATRRIGSRAVLAATTRMVLASYDWPGNVRELQNVVASLAVRSPRRGVVPATALPAQFSLGQRQEGWRLDTARRTFEAGFVRAALVRAGGHRGRAAAELGVTRQGLTKLMARLGIHDGPESPPAD